MQTSLQSWRGTQCTAVLHVPCVWEKDIPIHSRNTGVYQRAFAVLSFAVSTPNDYSKRYVK
jgi:hypothetical protein